MKNIKFNDWQEMALKKDTETIIRKLDKQEFSTLALCWEFFLVLIASIIDHLININGKMWVAIIMLATIPLIVLILKNMHEFVSALKRVKAGKYNVKGMVDVFDNQICYWVMMCNSYCNLLSDMKKKNERIFLYQEGCYYNNKSIQTLYHMKPVIHKVFSNDNKEIMENNNVAVYRLLGLLEMMNQYQLDLDRYVEDLKDDPIIKDQMALNGEYKSWITDFINDVNNEFGEKIEWK